MVGFRPVRGTSTDPAEFIALLDGEMEPEVMLDATALTPGKLSAADKAKLDALDPAGIAADIAAAQAAADAAQSAADAAQASADVAQAEVDAEEIARASGDSALATALASEVSTRAAADSAIVSSVSSEASARASADSAEASARAAADAALQSQIDDIVTTLDDNQPLVDQIETLAELVASIGTQSREEDDLLRIAWQEDGEWHAGSSVATHAGQTITTMAPSTVDVSANTILWPAHGCLPGEMFQFGGTTGVRPQVNAPYGPGAAPGASGSAGAVSNGVLFFAEVVDVDHIKLHGSLDLDAGSVVDFTTQGTAVGLGWNLRRYPPYYAEENANATDSSGKRELYNTIGCVTDSAEKRFPFDPQYADDGFDVPADWTLVAGKLGGEFGGFIRNATGGAANFYLAIDFDSSVRAHGFAASPLFKATAAAAASYFNATAHGLVSKQAIYYEAHGIDALPGGPGTKTRYYVKKIDADNFQLCTDVALTSVVTVTSDGAVAILAPASGSKYAIPFAASVPSLGLFYIPYTWRWWMERDAGTQAAGNINDNMICRCELVIPQDALALAIADGTTDIVRRQSHRRSRPALNGTSILYTGSVTGTFTLGETVTGKDPTTGVATGASGVLTHINTSTKKITIDRLPGSPQFLVTDRLVGGTSAADVLLSGATIGLILYADSRRYEWGQKWALQYFDANPAFTYAAGATLTGSVSGATGEVIDHDRRRKRITYRKLQADVDFAAEDVVTDGTNTLQIETVERGPLSTHVSQRVAVGGTQGVGAEIIVKRSDVLLWKKAQV